jgi:Na+-transporting NADH:ubiquinone oxidoreductase subunit NqrB
MRPSIGVKLITQNSKLLMWLKDARMNQILFLSLFLLLNWATRGTLQPTMMGVAIVTCLMTQTLMVVMTRAGTSVMPTGDDAINGAAGDAVNQYGREVVASLPSALITALGLSLLLRVDHYSTMMLAGGVAIVSKFLLKINGKHLFNPANFGVVMALTLTQDAWVSPGQWGESGWYALLFLAAGGIVLNRVGRWDTTVTFLATYAGLEAVRNVWLGWTWDVWAHRLMSGSLLLFALFMITDPRTIPNARAGRIIWAIAIAWLTFILRNQFFVSTAVFWALFMLSPLSILLDKIWAMPRFEWHTVVETQ